MASKKLLKKKSLNDSTAGAKELEVESIKVDSNKQKSDDCEQMEPKNTIESWIEKCDKTCGGGLASKCKTINGYKRKPTIEEWLAWINECKASQITKTQQPPATELKDRKKTKKGQKRELLPDIPEIQLKLQDKSKGSKKAKNDLTQKTKISIKKRKKKAKHVEFVAGEQNEIKSNEIVANSAPQKPTEDCVGILLNRQCGGGEVKRSVGCHKVRFANSLVTEESPKLSTEGIMKKEPRLPPTTQFVLKREKVFFKLPREFKARKSFRPCIEDIAISIETTGSINEEEGRHGLLGDNTNASTSFNPSAPEHKSTPVHKHRKALKNTFIPKSKKVYWIRMHHSLKPFVKRQLSHHFSRKKSTQNGVEIHLQSSENEMLKDSRFTGGEEIATENIITTQPNLELDEADVTISHEDNPLEEKNDLETRVLTARSTNSSHEVTKPEESPKDAEDNVEVKLKDPEDNVEAKPQGEETMKDALETLENIMSALREEIANLSSSASETESKAAALPIVQKSVGSLELLQSEEVKEEKKLPIQENIFGKKEKNHSPSSKEKVVSFAARKRRGEKFFEHKLLMQEKVFTQPEKLPSIPEEKPFRENINITVIEKQPTLLSPKGEEHLKKTAKCPKQDKFHCFPSNFSSPNMHRFVSLLNKHGSKTDLCNRCCCRHFDMLEFFKEANSVYHKTNQSTKRVHQSIQVIDFSQTFNKYTAERVKNEENTFQKRSAFI